MPFFYNSGSSYATSLGQMIRAYFLGLDALTVLFTTHPRRLNYPVRDYFHTSMSKKNALANHTMAASIKAMKYDVYKGKPVKFLGGIRMNTSKKTNIVKTKYKL